MKFESWEKTAQLQAESKARKQDREALLVKRATLITELQTARAAYEAQRKDLSSQLTAVNLALGNVRDGSDGGIWDGDDYVTLYGVRIKNARGALK
jgi:multidrug efflux pump subunit AcrA (membrane-fusion protein)